LVRVITFISFLITQSLVFSQAISVEYPEVVVEGQQFNISYTISATKISDLTISNDDYELKIINKRNPSRVRNRDKSTTYVFSVIAENTGESIRIPTLSANIKSLNVTSNRSFITVVSKEALEGRKNYLAIVEVNSNTLFEGESIIAELKVYFSVGIQDLKGSFISSSEGLKIKKLDQNNFEQSQEILDGKLYNTAILGRYRINGETVGNYEIPSLPVSITVRKKVSQGRITRYTDEIIKINTSSIEFRVLQIAQEKPKNYLGVFSELDLTVVYPKQSLAYSEAASLELNLIGKGNFSSISAPKFPELRSLFEIYEPSIKSDYSPLEYDSNGKVSLEYTLVPKKDGPISTDSRFLFYFNSSKEKFDSLEVKEFSIVVENKSKKDISLTPEASETEFEPIELETLKNPRKNVINSLPKYLLGLFAIILVFVLAMVMKWSFNKKKEKLKEVLVVSPYENFEKQLERIKFSPHNNDSFGELLECTENYLRTKFSLSKHSFTKQSLTSFLPEELANKSIRYIQKLELKKFGNKANNIDNSEEIRNLVLDSEALINQIEQQK